MDKKTIVVVGAGQGLGNHVAKRFGFTPLSLDKAALRALAYLLHDELKPKGIYVGTMTVCGSIGIDTYFAPARMAETYWQMYNERDAWEVRYEYPELQGSDLSAQEYWAKGYELAEKYK